MAVKGYSIFPKAPALHYCSQGVSKGMAIFEVCEGVSIFVVKGYSSLQGEVHEGAVVLVVFFMSHSGRDLPNWLLSMRHFFSCGWRLWFLGSFKQQCSWLVKNYCVVYRYWFWMLSLVFKWESSRLVKSNWVVVGYWLWALHLSGNVLDWLKIIVWLMSTVSECWALHLSSNVPEWFKIIV